MTKMAIYSTSLLVMAVECSYSMKTRDSKL